MSFLFSDFEKMPKRKSDDNDVSTPAPAASASKNDTNSM